MDVARKRKVLCIPDTHSPWVNEDVILAVYKALETEKFDVVMQMGDLYDLYSYSKFARSHDLCTPKEEIEMGYNWALNFWKNIRKRAPRARLVQLKGNHDDRLMKRAFERWPEAASIISRAEHSLYSFPNVETVPDSRDGLEIEGVVYLHGYLTKIGDHAKYLLKPVVHGHTHRGGTIFMKLGGRIIWELDCGFAADQSQAPLQYGPTKTTLWTEGYGIVDPKGPRFIPVSGEKVNGSKKKSIILIDR